MASITPFMAYIETNQFFQIELLTLLASLLLSMILSNSFPYFILSAICLQATSGCLIFRLFTGLTGHPLFLEAATTTTLTVLLLVTLVYALARGLTAHALRLHAATAFAFAIYLAAKAFYILEDTARPIHLNADKCTLEAAGFSAMHLLAALLMLYDCSCLPQRAEDKVNEKDTSIV